MFSGKTTELIRRLGEVPSFRSRALKHVTDTRFQTSAIVSHAGRAVPAIEVASAGEILRHVHTRTEFVGIDEGHFFDVRLSDVVRRLTDRRIDVVIAALQPDSWGRPFPLVSQLAELADQALVKHATCARCGASADRTQRLTPIVNGQMVVDPSNYEPRCQTCWRPPPDSTPESLTAAHENARR